MNTKPKLNNQVSLNSLSRTPNGQIYHQDLKNIFSILLFCLSLNNGSKRHSSSLLKFSFKKEYEYSFTVQRAIDVMADLHINILYNTTQTVFSYKIKSKFALELLQIFYTAKFLHCPNDKTLKNITKTSTILQPTPKGVALLHQFCLKLGIANVKGLELPPVLNSNFNSMQLMMFDRHFRTDNIMHTEHSNKLLFIRTMGPKENIWSSKNDAEPILDLGSKLIAKSKSMTSQIHGINNEGNILEDSEAFSAYLRKRQMEPASDGGEMISENTANRDTSSSNTKFQNSPFYHRFFTNPDSDSHIQYYVSNKGLRFFKQKSVKVNNLDIVVNNCFTGKALIQYLMDCTDLVYVKDALKIAKNFLKSGLITCKTSDNSIFIPSKDSLYVLTEKGNQVVRWNTLLVSDIRHNFSTPTDPTNDKVFTLTKILRDPGLKYLFRDFMIDNMCVENLDILDDIVDFQKKMEILKKMVSLKNREKKNYLQEIKNDSVFDEPKSNVLKRKKLTIYTAINKLSEYCLSKVYTIFTMYISQDSPNEVNIDSKLRFQIQSYIESEVNFDTSIMNVSDLRKRLNIIVSNEVDNNNHNDNDNENENGNNDNDNGDVDSEVNDADHVSGASNASSVSDSSDNGNVEKGSADNKIHSSDSKDTPSSEDESNMKLAKLQPNLVLNLKHLRHTESAPISPTDIIFAPKLKFLDDISVFYEEIKRKVYRMMETDSYGKFLASKQYKENYFL